MLGGVAPSKYLSRLETATPPVDPENLNGYLRSHAHRPGPAARRRLPYVLCRAARWAARPDRRQRPSVPCYGSAAAVRCRWRETILTLRPPLDLDDDGEAASENAASADDAALLSEVR